MYKYVLFDLDGTLTDPGIGITNSVMHALKKYNIEVADRSELYKFIGPPLLDSFMKYYGFSKEESEQAIVYYREYFSVKGLYENEVYDGIREMLAELKSRNKVILLATSKPEKFAVEILRHFGLLEFFDVAAGASMDSSRSKKSDVIAYALEKSGLNDISEAVMVGDREYDILGAKQFGMDSIGVLFGYGDYEELSAAGATYLAKDAAEILKFICENE